MDPYSAQFWEFTKSRELRLQRCDDCEQFRWPPAPVCDGCLSESFTLTPVSGRGTVLAWVTFRRQYFPEYPPPHTVVSLELAEGPLFITVSRNPGEHALADGMVTELDWEASVDRFGEYKLPVFVRAGSAAI
jgi:uncharacterized OB-fold protein